MSRLSHVSNHVHHLAILHSDFFRKDGLHEDVMSNGFWVPFVDEGSILPVTLSSIRTANQNVAG